MRKNLFVAMISISLITALPSCYPLSKPDPDGFKVLQGYRTTRALKSFAVLPLFEARKTEAGRFQECPITHIAVTPGPVPEGTGESLALILFESIRRHSEGAAIAPSVDSFSIYRDLKKEKTFSYSVESAARAGKKLGVDAVLIGSVLRYSEREGGAFAAGRPASLALTLVLLDVGHQEVLWTAKFDRTQKPLSDNILKFRSFWNSGMRWLTIKQLADNAAEVISENLASFLFKKP